MITIGGKNGAGKGTLSKRLADELNYEIISIGGIKRKLAAEMGITILEFDQIGWNDPAKAQEYDLKYEDYQKSLDPNSPVILDSRLGFWCQPKAFKVYLNVSDEAGAQRVYAAQRDDDANESLEAVLEANISRNAGHKKTYMKLYNVDLFDEKNYDLYIDTSNLSPDEVYIQVLEGYENFKK